MAAVGGGSFDHATVSVEAFAGPDVSLPLSAGGRSQFHCWLSCPLQFQTTTLVPLAVAAPYTSRHRPDWAFVIVLFALTVHFWVFAPLQFAMTAAVPALVPPFAVSRHRADASQVVF
jgi:hypothetical protein